MGRWLRSALLIYLVLLLMLALLERSLVFPAMRYPGGDWEAAERYAFQDVWFESADGTRLHGWLAEHPDPRGSILYCHGNAGNVTHRAEIIHRLRTRLGMNVFVFDYRGYGRSEGEPDEAGVVADAVAARDWLAERTGSLPHELILLGRSMGGAIATRLAVEGGARALVLENTFTSAVDVGAATFPFLPVRLLMRNRFDALSRIRQYEGPLIISHGTDDEIIPYEHGRALYDAAPTKRKQFVEIPGGRHNDVPPLSYYDTLAEFLQ